MFGRNRRTTRRSIRDRQKEAAAKRRSSTTKTPPKNPRTNRKRGSVDSKTNMDFDAAPRNTNRNPRARNVSMKNDKVGEKKTKGGTYGIYKKKSAAAGSFRSAFATAKKAGKKTFTWNGKRYTTKTK